MCEIYIDNVHLAEYVLERYSNTTLMLDFNHLMVLSGNQKIRDAVDISGYTENDEDVR